jgi:hypothetical protein
MGLVRRHVGPGTECRDGLYSGPVTYKPVWWSTARGCHDGEGVR